MGYTDLNYVLPSLVLLALLDAYPECSLAPLTDLEAYSITKNNNITIIFSDIFP